MNNMNNLNDQVFFFSAGDIVTIKHDVPNKFIGWIVEKASRNVKNSDGTYEPTFLGMKVRWFNKNGDLQEAIVNTKDLELVK